MHQVGLPYHWGYNGVVTGDSTNDLLVISEEPNVRIMETKALLCDIEPGRRPRGPAVARGAERENGAAGMSATITGFLTDSTLCIGCKACEVACKEWNGLSADGFNWSGNSYDNTGAVGHSTWRHVKFVEGEPEPGLRRKCAGSSFLGVFFRRLQALRKRRLSRVLSHGRDRAHRIWRRLRTARRLQRLWILRGELSLRRRTAQSR